MSARRSSWYSSCCRPCARAAASSSRLRSPPMLRSERCPPMPPPRVRSIPWSSISPRLSASAVSASMPWPRAWSRRTCPFSLRPTPAGISRWAFRRSSVWPSRTTSPRWWPSSPPTMRAGSPATPSVSTAAPSYEVYRGANQVEGPMATVVRKHSISYELAQKMVDAAVAKAREIGVSENVAILDDGGNLKAFGRMDGAPIPTIEIAQNKAYTALLGVSTQDFFNFIKGDPSLLAGVPTLARVAAWGGGFPIKVDGEIVGAIGVSGAPTVQNDVDCARAALALVSDAARGA